MSYHGFRNILSNVRCGGDFFGAEGRGWSAQAFGLNSLGDNPFSYRMGGHGSYSSFDFGRGGHMFDMNSFGPQGGYRFGGSSPTDFNMRHPNFGCHSGSGFGSGFGSGIIDGAADIFGGIVSGLSNMLGGLFDAPRGVAPHHGCGNYHQAPPCHLRAFLI